MDETDFNIFGKSKSKKCDKADTTAITAGKATHAVGEQEKRVIVSRSTDEDTYDCNNPSCGVALIFNHKEVKGYKPRKGTDKDRNDVLNTLKNYGFDVRVFDDLTFEEINEILKKTANENHSSNDCFMVVLMSHGTDGGRVCARDMTYPVERLWNPFLGDNCKTLINKPKLFFIQACRGENVEKPVVYTSEFATMSRGLDGVKEVQPPVTDFAIPSTADMLVMYSTFDKHFSFRNVENGSWFIQSFCAVLDNAANGLANTAEGAELLRLLTAVNRKVAYEYQSNSEKDILDQKKEMPNFLSTLTKTFYLKRKVKLVYQQN